MTTARGVSRAALVAIVRMSHARTAERASAVAPRIGYTYGRQGSSRIHARYDGTVHRPGEIASDG